MYNVLSMLYSDNMSKQFITHSNVVTIIANAREQAIYNIQ